MVSNENQLPPIEILKQLAQCCDQIEEQARQGKSVDLDSYVSGFPSEHQALVRSELQELLIELGLSIYRPEPFRKTEGYETSTQYHIIEPLGHGGMGLVNVAIDDDFRRRVALKEIRPSQADDEYYQHRFLQEAEISAKLEHPGILPIYNRGLNDQQQPFYTMRLIAGGEAKTLQQAIRDHHQHLPGSPEFINQHRILVRHLIDACNTVAYAHNQGVCHRDLKPANILIGPFGETLVVDWGLAKVFRDTESFSTSNLKNLAGSPKFDASGRSHSQGVGTLGFVAPENQGPEPIGDWPRIDVYSLGAILYCILTGLAPKESHSGNSARRKTDGGKTDSGTQFQRQIDSHVQKNIAAVCMKALCPDPSDRYGSALELAADLERYLAGEPVSALAESWFDQLARWSNRNRKLVAVSVLLGGILAGLSVFSAVQQANYNKRLTEESRKLSDALKEQERLRGQEQLAREMAQKQESLARSRELLALDSMRAYSQAILDNQTLKNSESLRSVRRELLEKPIEFFEKIQRDESEIEAPSWNYLEQLAKTCEDLSKLSFEYGDSAQAGRWAEQTIERYRQLTSKAMAIESATPKQIALAKIALAGAYRLRATNLMLTGQADLAENDLQESTDLFSEIRPESEWIEELLHGRSLLNAIRAVRAAETNRLDQMNDYFKSAISDRQELISLAVGQKKLNREKELQDLLQDQALVGLTFRTGDIDAHFRQFESYLGMLKERINNGDRTEETRLRLAWACSNLANRLIDYGRIDQCEPVLLEALQRRKELLNDFPSVTRYRFDLARTQSDYAFFYGISIDTAMRSCSTNRVLQTIDY
ncbi:MAG: serine/threonine protein kinase [Pirellula sp.]